MSITTAVARIVQALPGQVLARPAAALLVASLMLPWTGVAALAQAPAAQPDLQPAFSAEIEQRARVIGRELRCVVCQNQSIDDSNAPLALDLKQLLRERLAAGDSDQQAKDFLVARYGNFVLLKPPFQFNTLLLWLGPFLLLALVGLIVRRYFTAKPGEPAPHVQELSEDDLRDVDAILKEGTKS